MKKTVFLFAMAVCLSCSSGSDDDPSFDVNLLFGQWYRVGLCNEQNGLLLNEDDTYVKKSSGNVDCNLNESDTYQFTGNYSISNDNISFNQLTREIILEGSIISVPDFELTTIIWTKVAQLSENNLVIDRKIKNNVSGEENIYATSYER